MNRLLTATAALFAMTALAAAPAFAATAATAPAKAASTMAKTTKVATAPASKGISFKTIDANHDGKISPAELQKYWPKVTKAEFARFDKNKDGFYDHAELAAFAKAQHPAKTSSTMKPATMKPATMKPATKPAK